MKTPIELPDDLLVEAEAVAARLRTTLQAVVEHALRRAIAPPQKSVRETAGRFEAGELGIIHLREPGPTLSPEDYQKQVEEIENEDVQGAIACARGK